MLDDEGMAPCGFLEIFMTRKVLGSLSEISRESTTKATKIIAEQNKKQVLKKTVKNVINQQVYD